MQAAVNNVTAGETICVAAGSYTENVNVNEHLTLIGEGADVVTVTANSSSDHVFNVTADQVNISVFTATGAIGIDKTGIYLSGRQHCNISENNCPDNNRGIDLYSSSDNTLTGNNASNNDCGIRLYSSSDNTLTGNTANSNNYYGIYLRYSSNNLIYNNYFNNTNNAYDYGNNQWNITKTAGANIIGGPFLGGNYWSDYTGVDTDADGLGDTMLPYNSSGNITNGGDFHPLVVQTDTTPPVITITTPEPYGLYTVGMELDFSATDDESGVDTVVGTLTNTSEVSQDDESGFAPDVGVYTLVVTATDNASNTNVSDPVFFVVYDPDGGHATGGGWFCPDDESTLSPDGKANFGFTARYKNDVSTGKLNFQYMYAADDIGAPR
ncbi:MAG: hypothetical protein C4B59_01125 [Candidatus Methanogaster sp.]|uniref:Uncharacterized protein n=1 Tax=Candidatus Methanogaster sp. TaxID=3386292 RepID=A0AC61L6B1_9EURY|nr:MAG: hypothetical protein C4B59_01125 [ANME-2 cluster archaeon]